VIGDNDTRILRDQTVVNREPRKPFARACKRCIHSQLLGAAGHVDAL
jgi:hypothetical protein